MFKTQSLLVPVSGELWAPAVNLSLIHEDDEIVAGSLAQI